MESRKRTRRELSFYGAGLGLAQILYFVIRSFKLVPGPPAQKLRALGRNLSDLAASSPKFEEYLRFELWNHASSLISLLERELEEDLTSARSNGEAGRLMRKLTSKFGELMVLWPDVIEAAKRLRAKGLRLAQPIR